MAKQFQVVTGGNEISFPSSGVRIFETPTGSSIESNGATHPTSSTVTELVALANTSGTELIQATIVRVANGIQPEPLQMAFPCSAVKIYDSSLSGSSSVIIYQNANYYATETADDLVTAANEGGGGSSYLVYTANLTQGQEPPFTQPPTAEVAANTLGEVPTYSYDGVGIYGLNVTNNAFTSAAKTIIITSGVNGAIFSSTWLNSNKIQLFIQDPTSLAAFDSALISNSIEIRVYP